MATGKKINFRIPKKPPQPEESSSDVSKAAPILSIKEKLERAKKLAASLGSSKSTLGTSKDKNSLKNHKVGHSSSKNHKDGHSSSKNHKVDHSSSKNHKVDQSSSNKHKVDQSSSNKYRHETNSSSNHKKSDNDIHSTNKDVQKQTIKKPSYIEKLEKLSDEQKMEIIKKISGSLGRKGDKISDEEKLDKIRKISETIGKGSSKCEKVNNSQKQSSLTGKVDREKLSCSIESLQQMKKDLKETEEKVSGNVITMLGKTDDGIKREVKHFDRSDAEKMRQALQDKAARIKAMMNQPEEPKPKERKRKKEISAEFITEKSEDSPSEEKRKSSSDVRKSSSHSTENKSREKYNSEKNTETNSREEKTIKKKKMPPPPSMNFNDLLKIAEKKSQEPIKIEVKKPVKEEERLLTKRELKSQKEYQEFLEYKARQRKEAQREERESVEVKKEKIASSSLKSKSTSNLPSRPSNSSQSTLKKNPYSEKSLTSKSSSNLFLKPTNSHLTSKSGHKSSSPVPSSSKTGQKSVSSSSSAHAKPFTKNFKMQSSNNSDTRQHSDFSQAKKMKIEHSASERSSSKRDDIRKKSSGAKPNNYDNVGENVLVCGPPKSEKNTKPVASNPFDRIYGEIKKNQPSRPGK